MAILKLVWAVFLSYNKSFFLRTWALHIGHVFSLSNHVVTHSSQKICLQCNFVGSDKLSWQIGQVPPVALSSSWLGLRPYLWKIKKGYLEKSGENITIMIFKLKYCWSRKVQGTARQKSSLFLMASTALKCKRQIIIANRTDASRIKLSSSQLGLRPYLPKIKKAYLEKSGEIITVIILNLKYC